MPAAARQLWRRYGFAAAYLGGFLTVELTYTLLTPAAQARLVDWASTDVANLEHEPAGPLLLSSLVTPGYFAVWPVLIGLAVFGANRALGNVGTALVCLAGHVIGTLVSEGVVDRRRAAARRGQVPPRRGAVLRRGGGRGDRAGLRQLAGPGPGHRRPRGAGVPRPHLRRPEPARPGRRRAPDRDAHRRRGHGPHPDPPAPAPRPGPAPRPSPGPRPGPWRGLSRPRGRRPCRSGK
jgi:hypothetical protein